MILDASRKNQDLDSMKRFSRTDAEQMVVGEHVLAWTAIPWGAFSGLPPKAKYDGSLARIETCTSILPNFD